MPFLRVPRDFSRTDKVALNSASICERAQNCSLKAIQRSNSIDVSSVSTQPQMEAWTYNAHVFPDKEKPLSV